MRLFLPYCLLLVLAGFAATTLSAQTIRVDNTTPRLTAEGKIVDAHDGRLVEFNGTFYWYGTAYGSTNGFTTANAYQCYSSTDLKTWRHEGPLLAKQPTGVYYRPHVIYNAKTRKYVLWYNWYPQLWDGQFGVAVSDRPEGPFRIVNDNVQMANSAIGVGDFGLFVDDDGAGYISYNTIQGHQVSVERMADDFQSSTGENGGMIAQHMEAGTMFKRKGLYYLLTDYTCCFCNYGSGARVYVSDKPLSGYRLTTNINRYPGRAAAVLTDGVDRGTGYATVITSRDEAATILYRESQSADGLVIDRFTGNRPENCGDVSNPRVHPEIDTVGFELSGWSDGSWKPIEITDRKEENTALRQRIYLQFAPTASRRFRLMGSDTSSSRRPLYLNELTFQSGGRAVPAGRAYVTGPNIQQPPIIPAQQAYVMELGTASGPEFIWIGDLWGSASDNVKGHDYQYWSAPLKFNEDGTIGEMEWVDGWEVER